MPGLFVCPLCRSELTEHNGEYHCTQQDHRYPIRGGIPDFSTREHYWNQLTRDQMAFLLELAADRGYRYAVENVIGRFKEAELCRYILAANRADFRAVLPLGHDTEVLEVGAGWGGVTCSLAPHCRQITASDTNPDTLQFLRLRLEQDAIPNVRLVRTDPLDDGHLPFADGSFDLAILNGVLEYVGSATEEVPPEEAQVRGLTEVRRVLRPTGAVYVGIENRFGYLYFLGSRDHSGLRYTSLMPRWLASAATRMKKKVPYRTYTYSYRGYRRLLVRAGFRQPKVYIAVPNYRDPRFIVPADDDRAIAYLVRRYASYLRKRSWRWAANVLFGHTPDRLCGILARNLSDSFLLIAEPAS